MFNKQNVGVPSRQYEPFIGGPVGQINAHALEQYQPEVGEITEGC